MPLGGPGTPKVWNRSDIPFVSLSTANLQNFSFLSLKIWILRPRGGFSIPRGAPGGPRGPKVWNLSGIQFKSLSTTCLPTFSFLSSIMLILWPRGCFSETGDPLSSLGAPQGGFRAHILVEGCSFMLSHMFMTRINHKTFCCNLFEVGYLCTTK